MICLTADLSIFITYIPKFYEWLRSIYVFGHVTLFQFIIVIWCIGLLAYILLPYYEGYDEDDFDIAGILSEEAAEELAEDTGTLQGYSV